MLVLELKNGEGAILTNRQTGEVLAQVTISSIIERAAYTAVRLGFDAPQHVYISRQTNHNRNKGLEKNGKSTIT